MDNLVIRPATAAEFATAVDWAAAEGWNPGLDDLGAFHATDPEGFLMGFLEGEPVSSISVVHYGADYGFLGFYIVRGDMRGSGIGIATWEAGMAHLGGRTVGLDGVVAQQENYRKSGFVLAGRNSRFHGVPARVASDAAPDIRPVTPGDETALLAFDARHFPASRDAFLREWTLPSDPATRRRTLAAFDGGEIAGYGTIRACREGHKIGPLFARSPDIAAALFDALTGTVEGEAVALDTPVDNAGAVALARRAGLKPVFETARMYRGPAPELPIQQIFGVTTFELG